MIIMLDSNALPIYWLIKCGATYYSLTSIIESLIYPAKVKYPVGRVFEVDSNIV